jgi:lipid A 3-O-deacylase
MIKKHKNEAAAAYSISMKRIISVITGATLFLFPFLPCTVLAEQDSGIISGVKLGLLSHDVDGLWSGFKRENGTDVNCEFILGVSTEMLGGTLHPVLGVSLNTQGDTSRLYLDGIWHYDLTMSIFGAIGLGFAFHNGEKHLVSDDRKALGSQLLFHFPIEVGYRFASNVSVSLFFDHMSNGDLAEENEGLDTLGFRIGYVF